MNPIIIMTINKEIFKENRLRQLVPDGDGTKNE